MPSDSKMAAPLDPAVLAERFQTLATKSQAAVQGFLVDRPDVANIGMGDPAKIGQAFFELTTKLMADPRPIARAQLELWEQSVSLWARTLRHLLGGEPPPVSAPDKRFKHPEWAENAIFSYIRDSYLLSARAILSAVRGVKGLDEETSRKVEFYTKQFVDALAPSNFAATNPEVLSKTIETGGENLLSGLTNLLNDLQRGKGRLSVTMTDMNAFRLGENIATTPGKVVFQNEMIQLIQYTPMTEQVRKTPLLIIPPWINKFYVLDLQPKNSFIRWCVEQGHTVFVISWINPDARLRDKSFEHYMLEGAYRGDGGSRESHWRACSELRRILSWRNAARIDARLSGSERRRSRQERDLFRHARRLRGVRRHVGLHRHRATRGARSAHEREGLP